MKPFLNRLSIFETETLTSYLYRLFQANHYEAPAGIFNEELTKYEFVQNQINENTCKQWRYKTGQVSLYELSYKKINIDPDKEHLLFEKTKTKYCPLCLEEKIYQDFMWGFNLNHVCLKHRVYLLKECTYCKKSITIHCIFKNKCNGCGVSLSILKAEPITNALILQSQKELTELLRGRKEKFLELFDINNFLLVLTAFSPLFYGLNSLTQTNASIYKSEYTNKVLLSQEGLVLFLADIYWLFEEFDSRFPLVLKKVFDQEPTREVRRRRSNFENIIKSNTNLKFIDLAYQKHRYEYFVRVMKFPKNIKSYDLYSSYIKENYLTSEQLKQQFGILKKELMYLANSDLYKDCFVKNGSVVYFNKDKMKDLDSFLMVKIDRVTAAEAAELLGTSIDRVRDLKNSGLLEFRPYLQNDKSFSKKQIKQLLDSLKPHKTIDIERKITLGRCFTKFTTSGLSLSQLIFFIRENGLVAYTQNIPYRFCDLWFEEKEIVHQLKKERINTKGYNLKQVSLELSCTERTVMKYVNAGLLNKPVVEKINSKTFAYLFDPKEIALFKERYLTTKEIVREFNVSTSLINNAVYRGAVKNYSSGICRKTIINKKEFEEYMQDMRWKRKG